MASPLSKRGSPLSGRIRSTPAPTGAGSTGRIFCEAPTGSINGTNVIFVTAEKITTTGTDLDKPAVFYNGQKLMAGAGCDYTLSESVSGMGFDTITLTFPPRPGDQVAVDYTPTA